MGVIIESFSYIFKDRDWIKKLFKGGLIGIVPLLNISLVGYMGDVIKSIYLGKDNRLPEFNILRQFINGLKISIIYSIYSTVLFWLSLILLLIIFAIFFSIFNLDSDNDVIGVVIIVISFLISIIVSQVALSHYLYTDKISSLFDFSTIYEVLEKTWPSIIAFNVIYFIVSLVVFTIIGVMSASCILALVALWVIGAYIYYSCVVYGHFCGKVYLKGVGNLASEISTTSISKVETVEPIIKKEIEVSKETDTSSDNSHNLSRDKLEDQLKREYLTLKEYVKKVLNRVKEGEVIKDKVIEDLIKKEIDTLLKLDDLDDFELFFINGKPILAHKKGEITVHTTLGLSLIEYSKSPDFEKIKDRLQKIHFEMYKKENGVFFRGFDSEGNKVFSDVGLFIWNFKDINRLKGEVGRIVRGILRDRSTSSSYRDRESPVSTKVIGDFPGELLEKYIPLEKLGEGGFGKVFKVKRKGGTLPLAVKVPKLEESARKYLMKEMEVWRNLNHPNIVKLYDAFIEPIPHIEMEYIEGYNLNGEIIRDLDTYPKPANPEEAIKLIRETGEGIKHAHDRDIVHRDIKPSNILLTENFTPKITDWGLAKIGAKSTTTSSIKGLTLLYSAPEQIDEEEYGKTDKRTDIYQLGVLFYELITGRLPYTGTTPAQISLKITNPNIKPIPPSKIDPRLSIFDGIFEKLLAKRKEDRYKSMDQVLEALNSIEEIIREKEELKNTLTKTTQKLKISTDKREIERLTRDLVDASIKLALKCIKVNDKVGLLDTLELLKNYVKSEDNRRDLEKAISHIEYLIKEGIPIGEDTVEKLKVLFNRIRREWN